jgi:GTPase
MTPLQQRNLEDLLGCQVFDREQIILEIFKRAATTAEGRIQVEMASMESMRSRLAGKGIELEQQMGILGDKGPGETQKESVRRQLDVKIRQAKKRLDTLRRSRETQRKQRLSSRLPLVCLVGYTNAGKSSIINRVTKSDVLEEDKLFATLDTTTRVLVLGTEKRGLISDTIGFISQLPHNLIEAFRATLDELKYADLLLHVVDVSNHAWEDQVRVVHETLAELEVGDRPQLYVFNKRDKIAEKDLDRIELAMAGYEPRVFVHTQSKEGLAPLLEFLDGQLPQAQGLPGVPLDTDLTE